MLLPLKGVSQLDSPGGEFWDPAADGALYQALKSGLRRDIPVREVEVNINEPAFADAAVETLLGLMGRSG